MTMGLQERIGRGGPIRKVKPKHPSKPWELGAAVVQHGGPVSDNPYTIHTSDSYRWREGWEYTTQDMARSTKSTLEVQ